MCTLAHLHENDVLTTGNSDGIVGLCAFSDNSDPVEACTHVEFVVPRQWTLRYQATIVAFIAADLYLLRVIVDTLWVYFRSISQ